MKRFFALLLFSCLLPAFAAKDSDPILDYEIDLSKYDKMGFLITPGDYMGKYQGIKYIGTVVYQEVQASYIDHGYWKDDAPKPKWKYYILDSSRYFTYRQKLNPQNIADTLYYRAKRWGADAIVNFNIRLVSRQYSYGYQASGYAIKREN
jgi:hypothetical protein